LDIIFVQTHNEKKSENSTGEVWTPLTLPLWVRQWRRWWYCNDSSGLNDLSEQHVPGCNYTATNSVNRRRGFHTNACRDTSPCQISLTALSVHRVAPKRASHRLINNKSRRIDRIIARRQDLIVSSI